MKAAHPSSSDNKDTTVPNPGAPGPFKPSRPLLATAVIGTALIGYLIHKTADARLQLECLAHLAYNQGDLSERDASLVTELLARPNTAHLQGAPRYVF